MITAYIPGHFDPQLLVFIPLLFDLQRWLCMYRDAFGVHSEAFAHGYGGDSRRFVLSLFLFPEIFHYSCLGVEGDLTTILCLSLRSTDSGCSNGSPDL